MAEVLMLVKDKRFQTLIALMLSSQVRTFWSTYSLEMILPIWY